MSQKSSTFIHATRERETWLTALGERETPDARETQALLATAALARGTLQAIPVPEDAEEKSRAQALAHMEALREQRLVPTAAEAPWYLRLGHAMRFVFTFWKRR